MAYMAKKDSKSAKKIPLEENENNEKSSAAKFAIKRGLGRGLSALMSDSYSRANAIPEDSSAAVKSLALTSLQSGKYQPRGYFDEVALASLADSIRKNGVMQPILVRPINDNTYEIIAGERRWRAAKMAGLSEIPAFVRADIIDKQALELALVENIQREDLHPLEEAAGYRRLMEEFDYTQEELSSVVHKSRSHVANLLRLLTLPSDIRLLFADDKISMSHARALMGLESEDALLLANEIIRRDLSVRQTEKFAREGLAGLFTIRKPTYEQKEVLGLTTPSVPPIQTLTTPQMVTTPQDSSIQTNVTLSMPIQLPVEMHTLQSKTRDPDILALEETLSENLGLKVRIQDNGPSGEISIIYDTLEQLDEILRRLGGSV